MEYGKIIAVTGLPGLFELLSSKNDGAIVRSLEDKSTKFVSSRVHNFSHLESIEVFTIRENVNLIDVFHAMEKEESKLPDGKDSGALKKYFEKVYPDLDFERVYTSDLKKMVKWFEILKANEVEIKLTERQDEDAQSDEEQAQNSDEQSEVSQEQAAAEVKAEENETQAAEKKPKKAASKKKAETAADDGIGGADTEEKAPAKKSAPRKK